jgi:hypothetical protein
MNEDYVQCSRYIGPLVRQNTTELLHCPAQYGPTLAAQYSLTVLQFVYTVNSNVVFRLILVYLRSEQATDFRALQVKYNTTNQRIWCTYFDVYETQNLTKERMIHNFFSGTW